MSVIHIENMEQYNEYLSNQYVIIDYYGDYCKPCLKLSPELKILAKKYNINVLKIDVDVYSKLSKLNKIKSLPTIILMHHGVEEERIVGADLYLIKQLFKNVSK